MEESQDSLSSCSAREPFALQVLGDSMEPEFPDGCIVVFEPSEQCIHGMYIMATIEGMRWFRQYLKDDEGERLVALNELYPEIPLQNLDWKLEAIAIQRNIKRKVKHYNY
ncbi:S24 family peptidase [Thiolapillus sp.]